MQPFNGRRDRVLARGAPAGWGRAGVTAGLLALVVLAALGLAPLRQLADRPAESQPHNCRFWGLIGSGYPSEILSTHLIDGGLHSLRDLGNQNHDGWGFAYFLPASYGVALNRPIYRRGGPPAPQDEDYTLAVEEMMAVAPRAVIGHVRLGTSGHWGVPDPHPFQHEGAVFVHNGSVPVGAVTQMLLDGNPNYLSEHPPDWTEEHVDSELYFLLLNKYRRENPGHATPNALRLGIREIAAAAPGHRLNFLMTSGDTLYALRHANHDSADPVRFHPTTAAGAALGYPYWVVASQKMGSDPENWETIPAKTLAVFTPGQQPQFYPIDGHTEPLFTFRAISVEPLADIDQDGFMSRFAVVVDPDVEWGEAVVFIRILRSRQGGSWEALLEASDPHRVTGQQAGPEIRVEFTAQPDTLRAETWDLMIELYDADDPASPRAIATPLLVPALKGIPVEGAERDLISDLPPGFSIDWVALTRQVDQDGDGHLRSFRVEWDANYGQAPDAAPVYMRVRAFDGMAFRNLGTSEVYTIEGAAPDTAFLDVAIQPAHLPPATWDLVLDLYHAGPDTLGATALPGQFSSLAGVPVEGADHDVIDPFAAPVLPNPASGPIAISLRLPPGGAQIAVEIFDSSGRLVWKHGPVAETAGHVQVNWDRRHLSGQPAESGAYYYRARIGDELFERSFRIVR